MIGVDTNFLLRHFVQDDPGQARLAVALIKSQIAKQEKIFINIIVFCEVVWVLTSVYRYSKIEIIRLIEEMLLCVDFLIEESELIGEALVCFKESKADFSDCLIAVKNKHHNSSPTYTFDKSAATLEIFKLLKSV